MSSPITLVYIIGAGRSGSTILDTVLGNHERIESVGELVNLYSAWHSKDDYCACGLPVSKCQFWQSVVETWMSRESCSFMHPDWLALQREFERVRALFHLRRAANRETESFRRYLEGLETLYAAISKVSGKAVLVDSSKIPVRALAVSYMKGIEVKFIHLVRDGRGVASSLRKAHKKNPEKGVQRDIRGKPIWRSALWWRIVNELSESVTAKAGPSNTVRLRYEDLVDAPDRALASIGSLLGLDLSSLLARLGTGGNFDVGHTVAGNRLRMAKSIQLRSDREWEATITGWQERVFWVLAGSVARRYGYSRRDQT